jgi:uncharacterized protein YbaP (TraB family)
MKKMKKLISIVLLLGAFSIGASAQLLYKVSGNGLEKASYIVGTHRLINPQGVVQQISGIKDAMIQTDQMYFETAPDSASSLQEARNLTDGQTLKTVLTPAQYTKLDAFLKKYEGVGLASPHVQKRYGNLTPIALKDELEKLLFVANHMSEYDPTHTFSEYFEAQAKVNHEPMCGLNSVEGQVAHLKKLPMERQAQILMDFISNENTELARLNKIAAGFESQDADAIAKAEGTNPEVQAIVKGWAQKMPAIMAKPTLFVVEATKLAGDDGLLALLKAAGYTVEGVK